MRNYILARLREPSTHTALAGLLGAAGLSVSGDIIGQIMIGIAAVLALAGVLLGEKQGGKLVEPKE